MWKWWFVCAPNIHAHPDYYPNFQCNNRKTSTESSPAADCQVWNNIESIRSNLQVAAAGEDEEDLWIVDWQQRTAGWDAAHGDIEESAWRKANLWSFGREVTLLLGCSVRELRPRRLDPSSRARCGIIQNVLPAAGWRLILGISGLALPLAERGDTLQSAHLCGHGWVTSPPFCFILCGDVDKIDEACGGIWLFQ